MTTRGFFGRRRETPPRPIPPGQYLERGFPVLTAGPTQRVPPEQWMFSLVGVDGEPLGQWTWQEFRDLPVTEIHTDIHCVTKWSKLDTSWKGVTIDDLLTAAGVTEAPPYIMAFSYGGYTTNLPTWDVIDGRGMVAFASVRREAHRGGTRRAGPAGCSALVLLEVGEVVTLGMHHSFFRRASSTCLHGRRPTRVLGAIRLSHVRRSVERTAVLGRLASRHCLASCQPRPAGAPRTAAHSVRSPGPCLNPKRKHCHQRDRRRGRRLRWSG